MERKIGEIFEYNGEWYQCGEGRCRDCYFSEKRYLCKQFITKGFCTSGIIFKKLEKIGEPYTHYCPSGRIIYFQRYKIFNKSYFHNTEYIMCDFNEDGIISIEIKQTKEDMEEKNQAKHSNSEKIGKNLKEFDLEAAKAGKPVCTRDGRKARIICFDKKDCKRIVALVQVNNETEVLYDYYNDGSVFHSDSDNDLMMLPEKRRGWINVNKDVGLFKSREEAERNCTEDYVPVMVEFEI